MNRQPAPAFSGFWSVTIGLTKIQLSQVASLFFTLGIPLLMYLMFAVGKEYSDFSVGHGNVAAQILLSMCTYTVVLLISTLCAGITIDRIHGWTRTMALTPLGARGYIGAVAVKSVLITAISLAILLVVGQATGARMTGTVWASSILLLFAITPIPALLGFATGMAFPGEQAYGILGGGTALLSFLSGIFIPLDQLGGFFSGLATYTPLWGIHKLVLTPILGAETLTWQVGANIAVWVIILAVTVTLVSRRIASR
ncbi:MAG: hypothetical protein Q4P33_08470 [Flaviflexus sp.]|nr:hypothetical protein [Flaviflexus sp.]